MTAKTWIFAIVDPTSPGTCWVEVLAPSESAARVKARRLLDDEESVGDLLVFPNSDGSGVPSE